MIQRLIFRLRMEWSLRQRRRKRSVYSAASRKGASTYWHNAITRDRLYNEGKQHVG
jgi:hypothetical protein